MIDFFYKGRTLVGLSFKFYAHPLVVLVRKCYLFDVLQKNKIEKRNHWWQCMTQYEEMLQKFNHEEGNQELVLQNIQLVNWIHVQMEEIVMRDPFNWVKGKGRKSWDWRGGGGGIAKTGRKTWQHFFRSWEARRRCMLRSQQLYIGYGW